MSKSEILAPAGSFGQLIAAVRSGADAVYLGTDCFNARQSADNFGGDKLIEAVGYCHARNVRVYVAMNTLITDAEITDALKNIKLIAKSGADGVIVQDLAVAKLFRKCCPSIPVHASTQMTVHNVMGVKALEQLGFKRVVPARELTFGEIKSLTGSTSLETEIFIHGALCMSISGSCYLSSFIGGRSGNRGRCAQPCRLNFKINNRENALSLKDCSLISKIKELEDAGVDSFKIEGRMKRPEYAASVVSECKKALDGKAYNTDILKNVFSRSGFTDGYLTGKRTLDMFGSRTKEDVISAKSVLSEIAGTYKDEKQTVNVNMTFFANADSSSLTVSDGKNTVTVNGEKPQKAITKPLDREFLVKCFSKTGGTIFRLNEFKENITGGISLSASSLNSLRREALDKLYTLRSDTQPHKFTMPEICESPVYKSHSEVKYKLRFSNKNQIPGNTDNAEIILPLNEILSDAELVSVYKSRLTAELPALAFPCDEESFKSNLQRLKQTGVNKVYCENIGVLTYAKSQGFSVTGGSYLNILNSTALKEYELLGADEITLSHELNMKYIEKIHSSVSVGIIGYGYIPLMRFRACPAQSKNGCKDCKGLSIIKDRFGTDFYILCSAGKYSSLLNSVPIYTGDKPHKNIDFVTLYFTFENKDECRKIFDLYRSGKSLPSKKTGGLYYRELL